jgi:hypothetical protein
MVEKEVKEDETYYRCSSCGLAYEDEEWALKCEAWCTEHGGSCNLDIIQHAVDLNSDDESCC